MALTQCWLVRTPYKNLFFSHKWHFHSQTPKALDPLIQNPPKAVDFADMANIYLGTDADEYEYYHDPELRRLAKEVKWREREQARREAQTLDANIANTNLRTGADAFEGYDGPEISVLAEQVIRFDREKVEREAQTLEAVGPRLLPTIDVVESTVADSSLSAADLLDSKVDEIQDQALDGIPSTVKDTTPEIISIAGTWIDELQDPTSGVNVYTVEDKTLDTPDILASERDEGQEPGSVAIVSTVVLKTRIPTSDMQLAALEMDTGLQFFHGDTSIEKLSLTLTDYSAKPLESARPNEAIEESDSFSVGQVLQFLGSLHSEDGDWVGLELKEASGNTDGIFNGNRYFECPHGHGLFVKRGIIGKNGDETTPKPIKATTREANHIQSLDSGPSDISHAPSPTVGDIQDMISDVVSDTSVSRLHGESDTAYIARLDFQLEIVSAQTLVVKLLNRDREMAEERVRQQERKQEYPRVHTDGTQGVDLAHTGTSVPIHLPQQASRST